MNTLYRLEKNYRCTVQQVKYNVEDKEIIRLLHNQMQWQLQDLCMTSKKSLVMYLLHITYGTSHGPVRRIPIPDLGPLPYYSVCLQYTILYYNIILYKLDLLARKLTFTILCQQILLVSYSKQLIYNCKYHSHLQLSLRIKRVQLPSCNYICWGHN